MGHINATDAVIDYFNKNWKNLIGNAPVDGDLVADLSGFIGHIRDMRLSVHPVTMKRLVVGGYEYVGPGDIHLDVYFDVDHILELPIDHYLVADKVLIPWLQKSVLRYFGYNIFTDFADIVVGFYDMVGSYDEFSVELGKTNTKTFYDNPPKYWKKTDYKRSIKEQRKKKKDVLVLNFPKKGFEMNVMKTLGNVFVSGVFGSIRQSLDWVTENGDDFTKPLKTLVIGAHGNKCSRAIMSTAENGTQTNEQILLTQLQSDGFIGPTTIVFFTACYGADDLSKLANSSLSLGGHRIHGAEGVYNYVTGNAEAFYSCSFTPQDREKMWNGNAYKNWCLIKYGKYIINDNQKYNEYFLERGYCRKESAAPYKFL